MPLSAISLHPDRSPPLARDESKATARNTYKHREIQDDMNADLPAPPSPLRIRLRSAALWPAIFLALASSLEFRAQSAPQNNRDLGDLSIEELMNETVTSVSKHEQKVGDSAAAVFLLTNDDIRRSGATTIPDALRLVPGLDVAAVNARESAVSARGFNDVFSSKLLVLVDGRAVYTSFFSGVLWDLEQTMLEDLDRIEVIRGPGATVWGANAVNGVISVVSRSAKDTQGGLIYAGGGNIHRASSGVRYGGQIGANTYYRVFGSFESNDDYPLPDGTKGEDGWHGRHGGFRIDHYPDSTSHFTWQADGTDLRFDKGASTGSNLNSVGRWTKQLTDKGSIEIQAYVERLDRSEIARVATRSDTIDFTAQHTFSLGERNDVIWGAGYRSIESKVSSTNPFITVRTPKLRLNLYSAFIQDEFHLVPQRVTFTAGVKVEHNDFTGYEVQPSLRFVYKPEQRHTFWSAISRAVRTPDEVEGKDVIGIAVGAPFPGPGGDLYLPTAVGNGRPVAEVLWAYEAGYRVQPAKRVSVDLAAFYNIYTGLIAYGNPANLVPGIPLGIAEIPAINTFSARSYGGEAAVTVSPSDRCRLSGTYSLIFQRINGPSFATREGVLGPPKHQATLKISYDASQRLSIDGQLRYVAALENTPRYFSADLKFTYRPVEYLEFSLVGQNLLAKQHPEQTTFSVTLLTEVPRGFFAKLTLRF